MIERCPSCAARLKGATECYRCGADVALLTRIEEQVASSMRDALNNLERGDRKAAWQNLAQIDALDSSERTRDFTAFLKEKLTRPLIRTIPGQCQNSEDLTLQRRILDCALEVYRELGVGLALSAYEDCLSREMSLGGLTFSRGHPLPVVYKGLQLRDCARINHLVEKRIAVVLCPQSIEINRYQSRCENWVRLGGWSAALLVDFDAG